MRPISKYLPWIFKAVFCKRVFYSWNDFTDSIWFSSPDWSSQLPCYKTLLFGVLFETVISDIELMQFPTYEDCFDPSLNSTTNAFAIGRVSTYGPYARPSHRSAPKSICPLYFAWMPATFFYPEKIWQRQNRLESRKVRSCAYYSMSHCLCFNDDKSPQ